MTLHIKWVAMCTKINAVERPLSSKDSMHDIGIPLSIGISISIISNYLLYALKKYTDITMLYILNKLVEI